MKPVYRFYSSVRDCVLEDHQTERFALRLGRLFRRVEADRFYYAAVGLLTSQNARSVCEIVEPSEPSWDAGLAFQRPSFLDRDTASIW